MCKQCNNLLSTCDFFQVLHSAKRQIQGREYRLYGLLPKNDNSSSSNVARIAFCGASFGPRIIVIWAELSDMERKHKLSFYFIIWTVFNSIRDKFIPPEGPHSWHWKVFATLFVRHLESLGLF